MAGLTASDQRLATQEERAHAMGLREGSLKDVVPRHEFRPDEAARMGYPWAAAVDFNKRTEIDADDLGVGGVTSAIRDLMGQGYGTIVVHNPRGNHALGVGILGKLNLILNGSTGYFCASQNDGPNIRITGRVGWSCGENMMAGTVVIEKNAGSLLGATMRGGDLVCQGAAGARTGISMKGGSILVGGDTGASTGFLMQRGRVVICGDAGKDLGHAMYDGTIYVGGSIRSLGEGANVVPLRADDRAWLLRKLSHYGLLPDRGVGHFTKVVADWAQGSEMSAALSHDPAQE